MDSVSVGSLLRLFLECLRRTSVAASKGPSNVVAFVIVPSMTDIVALRVARPYDIAFTVSTSVMCIGVIANEH